MADVSTVRLKDGRKLAYAEYGDPNGRPLLYFHGWPSSRLEAAAWDEPAKELGVRILSIDRPGMGYSTYKKSYRIRRWPKDVAEFADSIGIERFAVAAISSGGPYGLACARYLPDQVAVCAIVAGVTPLVAEKGAPAIDKKAHLFGEELQLIFLGKHLPWLGGMGLRYFARQMKRDPDKAMAGFLKNLPPSDKEVMARPEVRAEFVEGFADAMAQGARGLMQSVALEGDRWGFRLKDITTKVHIFAGEEDNVCFPAGARYVANHIPGSELHMVPNAGHVTVVIDSARDILKTLLAE